MATPVNLLVLNLAYVEGMACSARVRNLVEPMHHQVGVTLHNLVYDNDRNKTVRTEDQYPAVNYKTIRYRLPDIISVLQFIWKGCKFIKRSRAKEGNFLYHYDAPDVKNLLFLLYAKMLGYKIVFDIVEDHRYITTYSGQWHRFRMRTAEWLLKLTPYIGHALICISQHLYTRMNGLSKGKIPVYLIPVSVDFRFFKELVNTPDEKDIRIFYGGSFAEKDGVAHLLNAFDKISDRFSNVSLVLTGIGLDADIKKYMEQISNLKNGNRITYYGYMKTAAYYKLLNECDIFCMTRINSKFSNAGFPFKLGEFLATGKAVIATTIGDVPHYLKHDENALMIEPGSEEQLVNALTYLMNNTSRIPTLGAAARRVAREHFDADRTSRQFYELLQTL